MSRGCACSLLGLWIAKVYNALKRKINRGLGMPDYPEYTFGIYSLRLRPNDSLRMGIARLGLPDLLNFFNASNIELMLRVGVPNKKENKNIEDVINYEWVLCTEDDKQVERMNDPRFNFYNTEDIGIFEFSMAKPPKRKREKKDNPPKYYWNKDGYRISVFKPRAVVIGNFSRLAHYKVIMRFTDSSGIKSDYVPMAEFTIHDKDTFRHNILLAIIGVVVLGIGALFFKMCGITL